MKIRVLISLLSVIATSVFSQSTRKATDAKGLAVGDKAPFFMAIDADSTQFKLDEALEKGPVVLIFYRGFWCPICNHHLAQIQDSLSLINDRGATVIAISPEKPEYLQQMGESSGAKFTLLYDEGYKIADAYDVTYTPQKSKLVIYNTVLGANLKETHSDQSQRLPIPATFIIGVNGKIVWRQFNPDYKKRSTVKSILENLPQ